MKNLFAYAAIALLIGAGCSAGDVPEMPADGSVGFIAQEGRSGDPVTTQNIRDFRVTAYRSDQWGFHFLMNNVAVSRTGPNRWVYSPPVEWPDDSSVDFFAVSPAWVEMLNNPWTETEINDWNGVDNVSTDLLIGVRMGVRQSSGRLKLNFRHALARIKVRVKCSVANSVARIKEVRMCNFADHGRFTFPRTTTTQDTDDGELLDNWHTYNSTATMVTLFKAADGYLAIGQEATDVCENAYFIPMKLKLLAEVAAWDASAIEIVYQIADKETGKVTWPQEGLFRTVIIDIAEATPGLHWLPGKTYVYTIDARIPESETRSSAAINCLTI